MDRDELEKHLHLTIRDIAKVFGKSGTTTRYWLKKHGLNVGRPRGVRPNNEVVFEGQAKSCTRCGVIKPLTEYYKNSRKDSLHSACKDCLNTVTVGRQRAFKAKCVEYKGGSCQVCGYDRFQGAFDFHHLDPAEKDFSIASVKCLAFDETVRSELDKCALLCANCHREVHGGVVKLTNETPKR